MAILVTGGAGFIGSHFINAWLCKEYEQIINIDKLSYAGNLDNITSCSSNHHFIHGDIGNKTLVNEVLNDYQPRAIINFAAETHVDRSIENDTPFIENNIVATHHFLQNILQFWKSASHDLHAQFRLIHVSTDEVFGSIKFGQPNTKETDAYQPNNPYSATKASSDHMMRAYYQTHKLPAIVTHACNNYGPNQYPEKLIPLMISRAISGLSLPIYGDGQQSRDWIHVKDHCDALMTVLKRGVVGDTYNIGGNIEINNLTLVKKICHLLDKKLPSQNKQSYTKQITFVEDRKGHDQRYAMDTTKIRDTLGFKPRITFEQGLSETVDWYLESTEWSTVFKDKEYINWINKQYA